MQDPNKLQLNPNQKFLVYQLGTNNWQRQGQFAPGSGILHQAHHASMNTLPGVVCYSMYPSEKQSPHEDSKVKVFKLKHAIPICESVSPVSNYRWHSMSQVDFNAYRQRLEKQVYEHMELAEKEQGVPIRMAIAHHSFLNPLALRNVLRRRTAEGKPKAILACFLHGTALRMHANEKDQQNKEEFPLRFYPLIQKEKVFNSPETDGVQICFTTSSQQVDALKNVFPEFPLNRVIISPNGINQLIFHEIEGLTLEKKLSEMSTVPYEGSPYPAQKIDGSKYKRAIVMVGKFAQSKRMPSVLLAAKKYEELYPDLATLIVGSGPLEAQKALQDLAFEKLKLKNVFFLGPQPQPVLAELYTVSNVGVFPYQNEAFGMIFVECMSCGTPVIGSASGGPLDFVDESVGCLMPEPKQLFDYEFLAAEILKSLEKALKEDWKTSKKAKCVDLVDKRFSVRKQCTDILNNTKKLVIDQSKI